jgi:AcrR family transcriptional regulator
VKTRRIELRPRREPAQARSAQTDAVILAAAARVLEREGPARFTTNRVAARAGVSIGSLYQYYPNKAALLFRLHEREWERNWSALEAILTDAARAPSERLREAVAAFFASESDESLLRRSLELAQVHFRDTTEFRALEARVFRAVHRFLREAAPRRRAARDFDAALVLALLGGTAERATREPLSAAELARWSRSVSEMLLAHLGLARGSRPRPRDRSKR